LNISFGEHKMNLYSGAWQYFFLWDHAWFYWPVNNIGNSLLTLHQFNCLGSNVLHQFSCCK
jgi:hypothetical protein